MRETAELIVADMEGCLTPGGKTYSHEDAREELKRRLAARGIGKTHET